MQLDFRSPTADGGVEVLSVSSAGGDSDGVIFRETIHTGPFDRACYFAQMQKYDVAPRGRDSWPNGANRIQPLAVETFADLRRGGMFLLVRREDGRFFALLPLTARGAMAWFESDGDDLALLAGNLGTGELTGELPLLSWALADGPYAACREAWALAIDHPLMDGAIRRRQDKHYPEIFEYLGWCSWEEFREDIDERTLLAAADAIEASHLPIRYMLVDDGHLDHKDKKLVSFRTDPERFPNGWEALMARRRDDGIRWMGLWLNFNGYWDGVSPEHELPQLAEDFQPVGYQDTKGRDVRCLLPADGDKPSRAFFDAMIGRAAEAGFDFVKVDNQAGNLYKYRGTSQPVAKAHENQRALEAACAYFTDGLINCMAHSSVCVQNSRVSAVNRCSEDYAAGDLGRARRHLHNSYANMAWLGQTMWGDHDMFHSNDNISGRVMAVSKAVSGGPVYLSDNPRDFVADHVRPLCYEDGRLLRPLAPATATPESLFVDPFAEDVCFRTVAPLAGGAAAVCVYNLTEPSRAVRGWVEAGDHTSAGVLCQDIDWPAATEGLICWDWHEGTLREAERFEFDMPDYGDRLFLLCPLRGGWAFIGRTDKYLSPASAEIVLAGPERLILRYRERGRFMVYRVGEPKPERNCTVVPAGENLWCLEATDDAPGVLIAGT